MSRNGSGTYSKVNTFVASATITAAGHNQNWDDIAAEITNSVAADGQTTMTGPLKASSGTVAAPGVTFGSDPDSGLYRIGANNLGVAVNGAKVLDVGTAGLGVTGTLSATGAISQNGFALLPVGLGPLPWSRTSAPAGWVLANGEPLLRASYPALWAVAEAEIALSNALYTNGNGTTTFTVVDMCGRIPAGADNIGGITRKNRLTSTTITADATAYGAVGGAETHTLTEAQLAVHDHGVTDAGHVHEAGPSNRYVGSTSGNHTAGGVGSPNGAEAMSTFNTASNTTGIAIQNAGSGSAHNNVQPTIITNYIIFAGV
jgi:microcystin-dependent protein